jgi:hypothetical protein
VAEAAQSVQSTGMCVRHRLEEEGCYTGRSRS